MGTCDGAGLAQRTWAGLAGTTTEGGVWGFTGTGAGAGEGEPGAWTWAGAWGETTGAGTGAGAGAGAATPGGCWVGAGSGFCVGVVGVEGVGVVGQIFTVPGVTLGVGLTHGSPPVWFCLSLTYFSSAFKRWIRSFSSFDSHWRQHNERNGVSQLLVKNRFYKSVNLQSISLVMVVSALSIPTEMCSACQQNH